MYSPRIREALIPRVYRAAKESGIPMTAWVSQVIEEALREQERRNESQVADADVLADSPNHGTFRKGFNRWKSKDSPDGLNRSERKLSS